MVDAEHAPRAAAVAPGCPALRHVLLAGGGTQAAGFPAGITVLDYDTAIAAAPPVLPVPPANGRSADDKIIIYTDGTTGLPKGVLWRHEDMYFSALAVLTLRGRRTSAPARLPPPRAGDRRAAG